MRRIKHSHTAIVRNFVRRIAFAAVTAVALAACSPTYNWRTLNLDSVGAQALVPCKPDYSTREVPLLEGQATITLHMQACDVGDVTYALSWLNIPPGQDANAAMKRWLSASMAGAQAHEQQANTEQEQPPTWSVKGAAFAKRYRFQGKRHDGQTIAVDMGMAQRGPSVVQLAIYGGSFAQAQRAEFWQGLAW